MKRPRRERQHAWREHGAQRKAVRLFHRVQRAYRQERLAWQHARNVEASIALALVNDPRLKRLAGGRL